MNKSTIVHKLIEVINKGRLLWKLFYIHFILPFILRLRQKQQCFTEKNNAGLKYKRVATGKCSNGACASLWRWYGLFIQYSVCKGPFCSPKCSYRQRLIGERSSFSCIRIRMQLLSSFRNQHMDIYTLFI